MKKNISLYILYFSVFFILWNGSLSSLIYSPVLIEVISFGGSIDDTWLTYFVRDELSKNIQIGCLVEVPFRNAIDYAIVTNIHSTGIEKKDGDEQAIISSENIRSIVRIVTSIPLLSPYQIRTIFACSTYYFVHVHQLLSLFLSKSLVRYLEKKDFVGLSSEWESIQREQTHIPIDFYHHTRTDQTFLEKVHEYMRSGNVIVFPDDFSLSAYIERYPIDRETTLVIPDKLTETRKYKAFCSVYKREKNIIIWTRRILYYNLSRYANIIYIEDALHSRAMRFGYFYKHLEILRKMTSYANFHATILSSLPSIESMYLLHMGTYKKFPIHNQF